MNTHLSRLAPIFILTAAVHCAFPSVCGRPFAAPAMFSAAG